MKTQEQVTIDPTTLRNANAWLNGDYDAETKNQVKRMMREDPKALSDAFFTHLEFGTGGLRGIMGVGTNRMNLYTVCAATQGLANYINQQVKTLQEHSVFIGYDSREHSKEFSQEIARVLAGNGIKAYVFKDIRPTPLVSFACRDKACTAAIMITASHNPPEYNGYKVYWSDGGQVVPPHDQGIILEANKITDPNMVKKVDSFSHPLIVEINDEVDHDYLEAIKSLQHYPSINHSKGNLLKVVYTSLHGTGITMVPKALKEWGFPSLVYVEDQIIPDGHFPTVKTPNPEEPEAMSKGIARLVETNSDILIATDPDADRMGIAVMHHGKPILLSGNQISCICLSHVCHALSSQNKLCPEAAFIKTIGTTELFKAICDHYQRPCFNVLTGFKYIAEKIHEWEINKEPYQYIFGGEESYGYLLGTFARDKDAVLSSALICEAALHAKLAGKTLVDYLNELYQMYGVYQEQLLSVNFEPTKEGKIKMDAVMKKLRESPVKEILNVPVIAIEDYQRSQKLILNTGVKESITLPVSNVLLYWLADGTKLMIRPSGTEPKVKLYCGVVEKNFRTIEQGLDDALKRSKQYLHTVETLLFGR